MAKDDKLEWFPFYHNRFIRDTAQWDDIEVGVYIRLLCTQWINGFLINDEERLRKITCQSPESFSKIWAFIKMKFTKGSDGNLRNDFLETVRKQQQKFIEKKSEAGEKGAEARWGNKFIKPTIEEIKAFCIERKNNIDPESFFNFYESKDWMIGKNKMKKWKSAIITWEKGNRSTPKNNVYIKPKTFTQDSSYAEKYYKQSDKNERTGEIGLGSELRKKMEQIAPKIK